MTKKLVAYFSASGVTKKVAMRLAKEEGADLFEIRPLVPYTPEDLDWHNDHSRSSLEMNDPHSRVELAQNIDLSSYDEIIIGFPIWWGVAPHIINTFLESHNLKGKTLRPFATSGGSGFGRSGDALQPSAPGATILPGKIRNA